MTRKRSTSELCPVCGSASHIHCSHGCQVCDDPENPYPRYASGYCKSCGLILCSTCMEYHVCESETRKS